MSSVYVCEVYDSLCDVGESYLDRRCYRTREDAERRAARLTNEDADGIKTWASVRELTACWDASGNAGTCHAEGYDDGIDDGLDGEPFAYAPSTWFLSCGHEVYDSERPSYCAVCGRKVVVDD